MVTNGMRVDAAEAAVDAYNTSRGVVTEDQSNEEVLIDLLSDLRHWAMARGANFDNAVRIAGDHFTHETTHCGRCDVKLGSSDDFGDGLCTRCHDITT